MELEQLKPGDRVYANSPIHNDGGVPNLAEDALIAASGARGMIVETGHLEEDPSQKIYLVRFEDQEMNLGPPVGCWPEELRVEAEG